jgi:hypothetical protein
MANTSPFYIWIFAVAMGLLIYLIVPGLVREERDFDREELARNMPYPAQEHSKPGQPLTRYERFEAVKHFLVVNGRPNVDRNMHLSDGIVPRYDCRPSESEVRVDTPVIDPGTGDPNNVTMLFCVDVEGVVRAANARTRYFTTKD